MKSPCVSVCVCPSLYVSPLIFVRSLMRSPWCLYMCVPKFFVLYVGVVSHFLYSRGELRLSRYWAANRPILSPPDDGCENEAMVEWNFTGKHLSFWEKFASVTLATTNAILTNLGLNPSFPVNKLVTNRQGYFVHVLTKLNPAHIRPNYFVVLCLLVCVSRVSSEIRASFCLPFSRRAYSL
jgi:hypothetical protein